jgi:hypothetical protein
VTKLKSFWHHVRHELSNARDANLLLAVVAGFLAWIITQLLRITVG